MERPDRRLDRRRIRWNSDPRDPRLAQLEPQPRRDLDQGLGQVAIADIRLHNGRIIALGSQHRDGVIGGSPSAAARLEAVFNGPVGVTDGTGDRASQLRIEGSLDNGLRFGSDDGGAQALDRQGRTRCDGVGKTSQALESSAPRLRV